MIDFEVNRGIEGWWWRLFRDGQRLSSSASKIVPEYYTTKQRAEKAARAEIERVEAKESKS